MHLGIHELVLLNLFEGGRRIWYWLIWYYWLFRHDRITVMRYEKHWFDRKNVLQLYFCYIILKVWRLYCQFVPEATRNSHRQHWAGHTVWSEGTLSRANCAMWRLLVKLANFAWKIESFLTCKRYHKFIHHLLVLKQ